jgi:dCTP deaminase
MVTDPKNFALESLVSQKGDVCVIPPNSYALAVTMEYFKMPANVGGLVTAKSTYARTGIVTPTTVLEPGWEGFLTLEIANNSPLPAFIYANEGIAQIIFFKGDVPCGVSYADRKGKYQGQTGVTPAIV